MERRPQELAETPLRDSSQVSGSGCKEERPCEAAYVAMIWRIWSLWGETERGRQKEEEKEGQRKEMEKPRDREKEKTRDKEIETPRDRERHAY